MASEVRPPGSRIRAASQMKALDAAQEASRLLAIRKCQVSMPPCLGRLAGSPTSAGERIITVASLIRARARRERSAARQHLLRILELPGAGDDHVGRHGDPVIEIAIVEVEFLREIGKRVPAAHIVIDGHARIPLGDAEDVLPVLRLQPAGAAAEFVRRDCIMIADTNDCSATMRQGRGQTKLGACVADQGRHRRHFPRRSDLDRVQAHAAGIAARNAALGELAA